MIPGSIARDPHPRMAASIGIPFVDRRQAALVREILKCGKGQTLQFYGRTALWHWHPVVIAMQAKQ
jgi:hypothetical protein